MKSVKKLLGTIVALTVCGSMCATCMSSAMMSSTFVSASEKDVKKAADGSLFFNTYDVVQVIEQNETYLSLAYLICGWGRLYEVDKAPDTEEEILALIEENKRYVIVNDEIPYVLALMEERDYQKRQSVFFTKKVDCDLNNIICTVNLNNGEIRDYDTNEVLQELENDHSIYIGPMDSDINYHSYKDTDYLRLSSSLRKNHAYEGDKSENYGFQGTRVNYAMIFKPDYDPEIDGDGSPYLEAFGLKVPENINDENFIYYDDEDGNDDIFDENTKLPEAKPLAQKEEKLELGDLNNSKNVDMTDLLDLSLYLLNEKTLTTEQLKAADVDENGTVNVADLALLKQYVSGVGVKLGK